GHLTYGTYDQWAHTDVFPTLYHTMTGGKITLSCAHGFQAITRKAFDAVLPFADRLIQKTEQATGKPLTWGFDSVMALSAIGAGVKVDIGQVPAQSERNRSAAKINDQFRAHLTLLKQASLLRYV